MLNGLLDKERLIHSTKTLAACLIAFSLTKLIGRPGDLWIVISVIVVMCAQLYVGSMAQKAYSRFLGTLVGCIIGSVSIILFGNSTLTVAIVIGLASFFFSYIATGQENLSYAGTLGAVTTALILLNPQPTLFVAVERFLEISIGLLIATIISMYVLPIHARTHLKRLQADTLKQLSDFYANTMLAEQSPNNIIEQDESIIKSLLKQRQLAKDARREGRNTFDVNYFMQSLSYERELLRAINYMHNALVYIRQTTGPFMTLTTLPHFHQQVLRALKQLEAQMAAPSKTDLTMTNSFMLPSIAPLKTELYSHLQQPSQEEFIYINGFLFAAETLINYLAKLADFCHLSYQNKEPGL